MNQDTINACKSALKDVNLKRYFKFTETREGEIRYYGETDKEDWHYLYDGVYKDFRYDRNENKMHIFKQEGNDLEWVETYNYDTDMLDIPVDIEEDTFLELAKLAHEQDITFNQLAINILQKYIDGEVKVK